MTRQKVVCHIELVPHAKQIDSSRHSHCRMALILCVCHICTLIYIEHLHNILFDAMRAFFGHLTKIDWLYKEGAGVQHAQHNAIQFHEHATVVLMELLDGR